MLKKIYKFLVPYPLRIWLREFYEDSEPYRVLFVAKVLFHLSPRRIGRFFISRPTVLFYPDLPRREHHAIYKICYLLGYRMTNALQDKFDIAISWEDTTLKVIDPRLSDLAKSREVINLRCVDIGKRHVAAVFQEVFGYTSEIDPLTFQGKCVRKSTENAVHDGKIIDCPIAVKEEGFIYQRLIDNHFKDEMFYDIRVYISKKKIPFVFRKYRKADDRFYSYPKADLMLDVGKFFSDEEIAKILIFAERMGLDYGELDVLRDGQNGKIYIVDVNNTPAGPRADRMSRKDFYTAVSTIADAFQESFAK